MEEKKEEDGCWINRALKTVELPLDPENQAMLERVAQQRPLGQPLPAGHRLSSIEDFIDIE